MIKYQKTSENNNGHIKKSVFCLELRSRTILNDCDKSPALK